MAKYYDMPLSKLIQIRLDDTQPQDKKLFFQLQKIGNNLNQIAKALNSHNQKIDCLQELVAIEKLLKVIADDI